MAAAVTTPLDVVKTRLQLAGVHAAANPPSRHAAANSPPRASALVRPFASPDLLTKSSEQYLFTMWYVLAVLTILTSGPFANPLGYPLAKFPSSTYRLLPSVSLSPSEVLQPTLLGTCLWILHWTALTLSYALSISVSPSICSLAKV